MKPLIRPGRFEDAAGILEVQALSWHATYAGLLPKRVFPRVGDRRAIAFWERTLVAGDTATRVLATADGVVHGFASGGWRRSSKLPADGEIYALYLRPEAVGQGFGRRLVNVFSRVLKARGAHELGLWVLATNVRARGFYGHLGAVSRCRQVSYERGVAFDEVAYVWDPIERASM